MPSAISSRRTRQGPITASTPGVEHPCLRATARAVLVNIEDVRQQRQPWANPARAPLADAEPLAGGSSLTSLLLAAQAIGHDTRQRSPLAMRTRVRRRRNSRWY
ncbi:MAG: hypothetical protein ACI9K5_004069 [Gammaproteobacteria bacterium]|jgi:hypothetical protein